MKISEVKKLKPGDLVRWNDPDGGACSKTINIKTVEYKGGIVKIMESSGDVIEAMAQELEFPEFVNLRLTLDVTYISNGVPKKELSEYLHDVANNAAGEGLLTCESEAEVEEWMATVTEIK